MARFTVSFQEKDAAFQFSFNHISAIDMKLDFAVNVGLTDIVSYEGSYEVTPSVEAQTLPTAEKYMKKDVNVLAIPYFDVSNTAGGSTVYIAETTEVNINGN